MGCGMNLAVAFVLGMIFAAVWMGVLAYRFRNYLIKMFGWQKPKHRQERAFVTPKKRRDIEW